MKRFVSLLSTDVPALLAGAEDRARADVGMTRTRVTRAEEGATAEKKFPPLRDEREGRRQQFGSTGMANVDHEIRSKRSHKYKASRPQSSRQSASAQSSQPRRSRWMNGKRTFASGSRSLETASTRQ